MENCCTEDEARSEDLQYQFYIFYSDTLKATYDFEDETFCKFIKFSPGVNYVPTNCNDKTTEMDFDEEYVRCAYSLRYSVLSSSSIFDHFTEHIQHSQPAFFENLIKRKKIRITCLGGGPATEIIAISTLFNTFLDKKEEMITVQLCYTIIDVYEGWEKWAKAVVKSLRNCSNLCNTIKIDVRLRFLQADLSTVLSEDVIEIIEKSHIITMVKFISTILNQSDAPKKMVSKLFSDIALNTKPGTWIFFLDFAGGSSYHIVEENMNQFRYYEQRGRLLHKNHSLDIKFFEQEAKSFRENSFVSHMMKRNYCSKVSSGIWLKNTHDLRMINRNSLIKKKTKGKDIKEKFVKVCGVPVFMKRKGPKRNNKYIDFSVDANF